MLHDSPYSQIRWRHYENKGLGTNLPSILRYILSTSAKWKVVYIAKGEVTNGVVGVAIFSHPPALWSLNHHRQIF